ncbi:hypothetical protein PHLGIDRAFT_223081 [Phlebiopsis gigantea 11061_1 CR5-6]|uniref:F-box domain-containing protein n=1 Tax=Phlebiopsis gigantea (strain 11061_1 CR5-6) TaxID=745531 RepID=A0A0C3NGI5_PHLG1|nr:hypothetical protein PHLGIDRAFT_223081 [Phlebiopsis gigantea 11061_1 CR5-6]
MDDGSPHVDTLAYLDSVPPEILFRIFRDTLHVDVPTNYVRQLVVITQVCNHWRAVALEYQYLWTYISLPCHQGYLETALQRSGNSPLRLFCPFSHENSSGFSFLSTSSSLGSGLSRILQEAPRIRQLYLGTPKALSLTAISSFQSLEKLTIASTGDEYTHIDLELDQLKALLRSLPRLSFLKLPVYSKDRKLSLKNIEHIGHEKDLDMISLPNLRELELEGYGVPCLLLLNSLVFPPHTMITMNNVRWKYPYSGAFILPTVLSILMTRCSWKFDIFELRRDGKNYQICCGYTPSDGSERRHALNFAIPATDQLLREVCNSLQVSLDSVTELILCNLHATTDEENFGEIVGIIGGFHQIHVLWFIKCTVANIDRLLGKLAEDRQPFQLDDLSIVEPDLRTCPARTTHDSADCTNCIIRLKNVIERSLGRPLPYLWIQSKYRMKTKNLRFLLEP